MKFTDLPFIILFPVAAVLFVVVGFSYLFVGFGTPKRIHKFVCEHWE